MWMIACGMNRSGSTLQYQIAVKIAETQPKLEQIGWIPRNKTAEFFASAADSDDTWYIAKFHDYDPAIDPFWRQHKPKAVYIYRDLRDVVVSLFNKQGWMLKSPEMGNALYKAITNYHYWTQQPGVLVSRYEDVMAEGGLVTEVSRIARHMEIDLPESQIEQIAASVSLDENKRHIENFDYENKGLDFATSSFDPVSLLHNNHIHSGAVGQWRTALTEEQLATVESWVGDWLQERGYDIEPPTPEQRFARLHKLIDAYQQESQGDDQIAECRAQVQQFKIQADQHQAWIEALRSRKIVRLMEKFGRPLV